MSKHETAITRWYWQTRGGLLCEEFCLVNQDSTCGRRLADAVVLPDRETRIAARSEPIAIGAGERAVVLQTKRGRLGMSLMGQTLFSGELLRRLCPLAVVESVALCTRGDEVLQPMLEAHHACRVIVVPAEVALTMRTGR
jgi:hypothetical protein